MSLQYLVDKRLKQPKHSLSAQAAAETFYLCQIKTDDMMPLLADALVDVAIGITEERRLRCQDFLDVAELACLNEVFIAHLCESCPYVREHGLNVYVEGRDNNYPAIVVTKKNA